MISHRALVRRVVIVARLVLAASFTLTAGYLLWHAPRPAMQEQYR